MILARLILSDGTDFMTNTIGYESEFHFAQANLGADFADDVRIVAIEFSEL
jgi:hypothetical protein